MPSAGNPLAVAAALPDHRLPNALAPPAAPQARRHPIHTCGLSVTTPPSTRCARQHRVEAK